MEQARLGQGFPWQKNFDDRSRNSTVAGLAVKAVGADDAIPPPVGFNVNHRDAVELLLKQVRVRKGRARPNVDAATIVTSTFWKSDNWKMVGAIGFEPTTYGTQNRRATKLRHAPTGGRSLHRNIVKEKT